MLSPEAWDFGHCRYEILLAAGVATAGEHGSGCQQDELLMPGGCRCRIKSRQIASGTSSCCSDRE